MELDILNFVLTPVVRDAAVGGVIGFTSGYALKKAAKFTVLLLGLVFILLEYLQLKGAVTIDYDSLRALGMSLLGKLSEIQLMLVSVGIPVGASFVAGFSLGLYKG